MTKVMPAIARVTSAKAASRFTLVPQSRGPRSIIVRLYAAMPGEQLLQPTDVPGGHGACASQRCEELQAGADSPAGDCRESYRKASPRTRKLWNEAFLKEVRV